MSADSGSDSGGKPVTFDPKKQPHRRRLARALQEKVFRSKKSVNFYNYNGEELSAWVGVTQPAKGVLKLELTNSFLEHSRMRRRYKHGTKQMRQNLFLVYAEQVIPPHDVVVLEPPSWAWESRRKTTNPPKLLWLDVIFKWSIPRSLSHNTYCATVAPPGGRHGRIFLRRKRTKYGVVWELTLLK